MCEFCGRADEDRRNNQALKAQVSANLLKKAEDRDRLQQLLDEMDLITSGRNWTGDNIRSSIRGLSYIMSRTTSTELRERAANDCYLGNCTAFYRSV